MQKKKEFKDKNESKQPWVQNQGQKHTGALFIHDWHKSCLFLFQFCNTIRYNSISTIIGYHLLYIYLYIFKAVNSIKP